MLIQKILAKCGRAGLHPKFLRILSSWVYGCTTRVDVNRIASQACPLKNMVFQGTMLGPLLWNVSFKDIGTILHEHSFQDLIFADDLNGMRLYPTYMQDHLIRADVDAMQKKREQQKESEKMRSFVGHFNLHSKSL